MTARFTYPTPEVPVFFASTEGQTRAIADRLAAVLRGKGFDSRTVDLAGPDAAHVDWARVRGALLGASLHMGRHQQAAVEFVRRHAVELNARPSVFFSVSLGAASANEAERREVLRIAEAMPHAAGWAPRRVVSLAGRLAYTKYGFFKRLMLKRIAKKEGGPTDTSRDHELTNWEEVERVARDLAEAMLAEEERRNGAPAA